MEHSVEASARARAAVDAFLRGGSSSSSDGDIRLDDGGVGTTLLEARPNRLGLGATASTTTPTQGDGATERARSRLERSLRVQLERKAAAAEEASASSSDEGMVSRTRVVGVKRRRRRNISKQARNKGSGSGDISMQPVTEEKKDETMSSVTETKPSIQVVADIDNVGAPGEMEMAGSKRKRRKKRREPREANGDGGPEGTMVEDITMATIRPEVEEEHNTERAGASSSAPHNFGNAGGMDEKRKKKKTRSRQKNLRRDNRPKHLLPSHLNEETLNGRRLPRHDGAAT